MTDSPTADLVLLVADKNMQFAAEGLLRRFKSLRIRKIAFETFVHPQRDAGCLRRAELFLRPFVSQFAYALVMLDREGCGRESDSRDTLEDSIERRLTKNGWRDRAAAIALDPELEIWVWSDSPEVDVVLGWQSRETGLREWLASQGLSPEGQVKPNRPKEVMELALRESRKRRSSALYAELASRIGMNRCVDPAFIKFKRTLRNWFSSQA